MSKKKIGILGSGQVAQKLADGFLKYGYEVFMGTRDVSQLAEWKSKATGKVQIGSFEDASKFADTLVLSVKGIAAESVIRDVTPHLIGKTVIDTTNPIAQLPPENGVIKYFTDLNHSLMERLQQAAPKAHFVKAFSSVGNMHMVNPDLPGGKPTMFIAGNSAEAKKEVTGILHLFGWQVADMGKVESARAIEPLCILWCIPGILHNEWSHAFKLLKK
jgi:8-hydroxy-5-deazaflavin:NADPH oxidoreductase